jgi:hypothetical protein
MRWSAPKHRIGDVLVSLGLISRAELGLALSAQRASRERLGEILVRLGFIDRAQLLAGLMEQYRRCVAGAVGMSMLFLQQGMAYAGSSGTIHLSGTVPPRSILRLIEGSLLPSIDLQRPVRNALLGSFVDESNTSSGYELVLVSQSAATYGGQTRLVGDDGASLPYKLAFAGQEVRFKGGEAMLATIGPRSGGGGSGALTLSTATGAPRTAKLQDVLSIIVRAR